MLNVVFQSNGARKKIKNRPDAKLFDPETIKTLGGEITTDGDFLVFQGDCYSKKGFLYKNFAMSAIISDGL